MIIDAVIFMSEFRIVLYENDVNRRIVDLCFFGSSAHLPVCLLCQMIAFYVVEVSEPIAHCPRHKYLGKTHPLRTVGCLNKGVKKSSVIRLRFIRRRRNPYSARVYVLPVAAIN